MAVRQNEFFMQKKFSSVLLLEKLALSTYVHIEGKKKWSSSVISTYLFV